MSIHKNVPHIIPSTKRKNGRTRVLCSFSIYLLRGPREKSIISHTRCIRTLNSNNYKTLATEMNKVTRLRNGRVCYVKRSSVIAENVIFADAPVGSRLIHRTSECSRTGS